MKSVPLFAQFTRSGSHTMTHPNMAHISETEAQMEFSESKRRLEQEICQPVVHFSYPGPGVAASLG